MDEIIRRYKGRTTSQGHKLDVTRDGDEITIAFQHTGEYGGDYDPYVRVAIIRELDEGFELSVFELDAEEPTSAGSFTDVRDLFVALDTAVEQRSQELGPIES